MHSHISTNKSPLVSIIIPCYNYAHFLAQTLDSVLSQSYQNWECIVVDDGSTDNTRAVVAGYIENDKRFKYTYQSNQGQSPTRNNGIRHAQGGYIQFLDADDVLESCKLEQQVSFLEQNPAVDIVYGNVMYFIDSIKEEDLLFSRYEKNESWMPKISGQGEYLVEQLIRGNIAELGSLLFRNNIIKEVSDFDVAIQSVEDWDYCIRCALAGKRFQYFEGYKDRLFMRHHPNSFSKNKRKMLEGAILVHQKVERLYSQQIGKRLRKINLQCLNGNRRILGEWLMKKGNIWRGMFLLSQAYIFDKKLQGLPQILIRLSYQRLKVELKKILISPINA
jgi:glycosyltransferase involved in cell wall biosynthesis